MKKILICFLLLFSSVPVKVAFAADASSTYYEFLNQLTADTAISKEHLYERTKLMEKQISIWKKNHAVKDVAAIEQRVKEFRNREEGIQSRKLALINRLLTTSQDLIVSKEGVLAPNIVSTYDQLKEDEIEYMFQFDSFAQAFQALSLQPVKRALNAQEKKAQQTYFTQQKSNLKVELTELAKQKDTLSILSNQISTMKDQTSKQKLIKLEQQLTALNTTLVKENQMLSAQLAKGKAIDAVIVTYDYTGDIVCVPSKAYKPLLTHIHAYNTYFSRYSTFIYLSVGEGLAVPEQSTLVGGAW
ncbi:MAG: hypothetical protein ACRC5C_12460 [Bacilli bacterium]